MVKPVEHGVENVERVLGENILAGNVTEVEECVESFDDIGMHKAFERVDENLV